MKVIKKIKKKQKEYNQKDKEKIKDYQKAIIKKIKMIN